MLRRHAPIILALLLVATAAANAQPRPSFDCATARSAAERAICAAEDLAGLDREIAAAYAAARRLHPSSRTREALRDQQREFLAYRDSIAESDPAALAETLATRRDALARIAAPRTGFAGTWESASGTITVERRGNGRFAVTASNADLDARWTCDLEDEAKPDRTGALRLDMDEGWTLRLTLTEGVLRAEDIAPRNPSGGPPVCGNGGGFAGVYFPVTP